MAENFLVENYVARLPRQLQGREVGTRVGWDESGFLCFFLGSPESGGLFCWLCGRVVFAVR